MCRVGELGLLVLRCQCRKLAQYASAPHISSSFRNRRPVSGGHLPSSTLSPKNIDYFSIDVVQVKPEGSEIMPRNPIRIGRDMIPGPTATWTVEGELTDDGEFQIRGCLKELFEEIDVENNKSVRRASFGAFPTLREESIMQMPKSRKGLSCHHHDLYHRYNAEKVSPT